MLPLNIVGLLLLLIQSPKDGTLLVFESYLKKQNTIFSCVWEFLQNETTVPVIICMYVYVTHKVSSSYACSGS